MHEPTKYSTPVSPMLKSINDKENPVPRKKKLIPAVLIGISTIIMIYLDLNILFQSFAANTDSNSIVQQNLIRIILARFIRIHPTHWETGVSIRIEFLGKHLGKWQSNIVYGLSLNVNSSRGVGGGGGFPRKFWVSAILSKAIIIKICKFLNCFDTLRYGKLEVTRITRYRNNLLARHYSICRPCRSRVCPQNILCFVVVESY